MFDFSGKNVVITGAGSGIGEAAARQFADHGATVVIVDVDEEAARDTESSLDGQGHLTIVADVSDRDDVVAMADEVGEALDGVHVLFNNAGISNPSQPIEELSEADWDEVMDVNLKSAFLCTKYLLPYLRAVQTSSIVNNASISAEHPRPGTAAYATSNGGMVTLTKQLAIEFLDDDIRVNAINATATDTMMIRDLMSASEGSGYVSREQIVSSIPAGRMVTAEEVASAALYLASDRAAMINGSCLPMEGGRTL